MVDVHLPSVLIATPCYGGQMTVGYYRGLELIRRIKEGEKTVTGEVSLNLYKGNVMVAGRTSPNSLYDEGIATMEGGGSYNQDDAEGFMRIQGLPSRVQARVTPREF